MFYLLLAVCVFGPPKVQEGKLEVISTRDSEVFNIIYKGDMKWNVQVTLYNEKGKKKLQQEIPDTDGFILPISLRNERSGTYTVEIFTPVYDLKKEFTYTDKVDQLISLLGVGFNKENLTINISSEEPIDIPFDVYILNEKGDQLVMDKVDPLGGKITRIYNLRGAPATQLQLIIMNSGNQVIRKTFD